MKNWTIGKRITVGFAAVIVVLLALSALVRYEVEQIATSSLIITTESLPNTLHVAEGQLLSADNTGLIYRHISSTTPADMQAIEKHIADNSARVTELLTAYDKVLTNPADRPLFDELIRTRTAYSAQLREVIALSQKTEDAAAVAAVYTLARTKLDPLADAYSNAYTALSRMESDDAGIRSKEVTDSITTTKLALLIFTAAGFVVAVGIAFAIIRSVNQQLRRNVSILSESSGQTASAAAEISRASQSLAAGASEQAASLEETSASLEEVSSMVKRNAQNAQSARELSGQARHTAEAGVAGMQAMARSTDGIRHASAEMRSSMDGIRDASADVSKIIKTIDEIAFQTNLLALNAAVEAARAGEAGMGFAVVADEVRNLAQRSAKAARETADMIEASIKRSEEGVKVTEKVSLAVEDVATKARDVEKHLTEILTKSQQVDEQVASIANASHEQSQGISQVATAVTQMDKVTQSNAAAAEQSASAAEELNAQALALRGAVADLEKLSGSAQAALGSASAGLVSPIESVAVKTPKLSPRPHAAQPKKGSFTAATASPARVAPADFRDF
jgi:methyl-accepting chemotaxis protein